VSDNKFSKGEAIRFGWDRMKDNLGFFIVYLIILFSVEFFFSAFAGLFEDSLPFLSFIFNVGYWIVIIISSLFVVKIGLRLYDNQKIGSYDFLSFTSSLFIKFLLGYILYWFFVLIGPYLWKVLYEYSVLKYQTDTYYIFMLIGFLVLIIVSTYLAIKYQFAFYLIVDKNMDVFEAFKESGRLTDGYKWILLLFLIVLLIMGLIGAMVFLVGLFVTIPIAMIALAHVYKQLSALTSNVVTASTAVPPDMPASDNPFQPPAPIS